MYTNTTCFSAMPTSISDQSNNRKSTLTLASTDEMVQNNDYFINLIENIC